MPCLQDRCHRIGQTRPVTIYKLFAEDTVDEDIYAMGERKSKLSKAVLQDDRQHQQQQQQQGMHLKHGTIYCQYFRHIYIICSLYCKIQQSI